MQLDDIPTFHKSVELSYWLGSVQQELGIKNDALDNLQAYLSRIDSGPLSADAKIRLQRLNNQQPTGLTN